MTYDYVFPMPVTGGIRMNFTLFYMYRTPPFILGGLAAVSEKNLTVGGLEKTDFHTEKMDFCEGKDSQSVTFSD